MVATLVVYYDCHRVWLCPARFPSLRPDHTPPPRKPPMNRATVLNHLRAHKAVMAQRFGVVDLALFGSFARDAATDASDVDILVRFDGPATSKGYFGTQFYIEDLLGRPVDLVTDKALRKELRPYIEREIVNV